MFPYISTSQRVIKFKKIVICSSTFIVCYVGFITIVNRQLSFRPSTLQLNPLNLFANTSFEVQKIKNKSTKKRKTHLFYYLIV